MDIVLFHLPYWGAFDLIDLCMVINLLFYALGWWALKRMRKTTADMLKLSAELKVEIERLADTDEK